MFNIDLDAVDSYEIAGRIITVVQGKRKSRYVLPASAARITLWEHNDKSNIEIGGFTKVTVRVSGRPNEMRKLYEFLR